MGAPFRQGIIETPLGPMALVHGDDGLLWAAEFFDDPARLLKSLTRYGITPIVENTTVPTRLRDAFAAYFAGELHALETLPTGSVGSSFERAVWSELRRIPVGETRSYGDLARALGGQAHGQKGQGANARAVGGANGRNPLAIVVPCHRVIGADGSLTGYAGGLTRKAWLLAHEGWETPQKGLF